QSHGSSPDVLLSLSRRGSSERSYLRIRSRPEAGDNRPHESGIARELFVQRESHAQQDLIVPHLPAFDMASGLYDLEPFHLANGLRCTRYCLLDGIFDALFG